MRPLERRLVEIVIARMRHAISVLGPKATRLASALLRKDDLLLALVAIHEIAVTAATEVLGGTTECP
jgi:hypothetical protein